MCQVSQVSQHSFLQQNTKPLSFLLKYMAFKFLSFVSGNVSKYRERGELKGAEREKIIKGC